MARSGLAWRVRPGEACRGLDRLGTAWNRSFGCIEGETEMLEKVEATLIGVAPLLMNNGRKANPLDEWTQKLSAMTKKRQKTLADFAAIREVEWYGGIYTDLDKLPALPADNVLAMIVDGAKKSKRGEDAKAAVFETQPYYRLSYDGPKDLAKLYAAPGFCDYRSVSLNQRRTMRARPRFASWMLPIAVMVNTDILEVTDVLRALEDAGERVGIGDYTPRFGRFTVET